MGILIYDSDQIRALARVLASAALDELLDEMADHTKTNAAAPDKRTPRRSGELDGADGTRSISR
jgi:hypothetical protein